ncbi:MAG TPA: hypothetical protein VL651_03690 [Bacteroidia bacterium]|jgi:hypothetical protein|nr:hypothetical protein [Bacteroidia bacterium]
METHKKEVPYNHLYAGLITALMLIVYFLAMRIAGLAIYPEFRLFNFVILFAGIYYSEKREEEFSDKGFFSRLADGCLTVFTSVSIFAVFIYTWLSFDTYLMDALKASSNLNSYIAPETAAIAVFAEGISSGIIMSYIFIAYTDSHSTSTKRDRNEIEVNK